MGDRTAEHGTTAMALPWCLPSNIIFKQLPAGVKHGDLTNHDAVMARNTSYKSLKPQSRNVDSHCKNQL